MGAGAILAVGTMRTQPSLRGATRASHLLGYGDIVGRLNAYDRALQINPKSTHVLNNREIAVRAQKAAKALRINTQCAGVLKNKEIAKKEREAELAERERRAQMPIKFHIIPTLFFPTMSELEQEEKPKKQQAQKTALLQNKAKATVSVNTAFIIPYAELKVDVTTTLGEGTFGVVYRG